MPYGKSKKMAGGSNNGLYDLGGATSTYGAVSNPFVSKPGCDKMGGMAQSKNQSKMNMLEGKYGDLSSYF